MQYMQTSSSCFILKDNIIMFSISNNMIKMFKELPHTGLINMCYSRKMCVTLVILVGNNQAQYMELNFYVLNKKHIYLTKH